MVIPNKIKILGVKTKYKLMGNDHKNDISIKKFLDVKEAIIARQAGRNNIKNVINIGPTPLGSE
ncbi:hypothetical protein VBD025_15275 [Virgibacillus flavescens]|uniref:hypothetical protein n=1 Tax=Virgibacillus flavescens TaxID=1611422 RepID=UPI003D350808